MTKDHKEPNKTGSSAAEDSDALSDEELDGIAGGGGRSASSQLGVSGSAAPNDFSGTRKIHGSVEPNDFAGSSKVHGSAEPND